MWYQVHDVVESGNNLIVVYFPLIFYPMSIIIKQYNYTYEHHPQIQTVQRLAHTTAQYYIWYTMWLHKPL